MPNHKVKIESMNSPQRVVLRFHVRYELQEAAINERFFALYGHIYPADDVFSHMMAPNESSKMHIVLDINPKSHPTIDNNKIEYAVFRVTKKNDLYVVMSLVEGDTKPCFSEFEKLDTACDSARVRCARIKWGTDRSQSEELDGVRASHVGHCPATFVS